MGIYDRPYYQDENRYSFSFSGRSVIVNLIIVNAAIFLIDAFIFGGSDSSFRPSHLLSAKPETLLKPWMWWQFLTYGFCHDPHNTGHILGNMVGLFFLGQEVERHYGSKLFLRMYLTALIVCSVVWAGVDVALGQMNTSLIGASGAVTAVIILFALNFPRRMILLMMFIPMPAWVLGVMLIVFNVMGANSATPAGDRIAYDVHLTGAAYAFLFFHSSWALGGWLSGGRVPKLRLPTRRPKLKVHDPERRYQVLDEQADVVLDKLHREGHESLNSREKRVLEDYSRRMQQKRR